MVSAPTPTPAGRPAQPVLRYPDPVTTVLLLT